MTGETTVSPLDRSPIKNKDFSSNSLLIKTVNHSEVEIALCERPLIDINGTFFVKGRDSENISSGWFAGERLGSTKSSSLYHYQVINISER